MLEHGRKCLRSQAIHAFDTTPDKGTDASRVDLDQRDVRALTELLTVVPDAPGLYLVVSESENTYRVDTREGRCDCPDAQHNLGPDEQCKHERRVAFETGVRAVPAWVNRDELPHDFAEHIPEKPVFGATDGGEALESDKDAPNTPGRDVTVWTEPFPEYDRYGNRTGTLVVECTECGIEVTTGGTDTATHREGCMHR